MEELNDSMHVSLLEDQEVARFHIERHKLLGDELHPQDRYIFDVRGGDGRALPVRRAQTGAGRTGGESAS